MSPTNAAFASELVRRACGLLASGSAGEAARDFRAAIDAAETLPGVPLSAVQREAHLGLVRALRAAGRLEPSIGAALAFTALAPADAEAHLELAASLWAAGHLPQARSASARGRLLAWRRALEASDALGKGAEQP